MRTEFTQKSIPAFKRCLVNKDTFPFKKSYEISTHFFIDPPMLLNQASINIFYDSVSKT